MQTDAQPCDACEVRKRRACSAIYRGGGWDPALTKTPCPGIFTAIRLRLDACGSVAQ